MARQSAANSTDSSASSGKGPSNPHSFSLAEVQRVRWPLQAVGSFYAVRQNEVTAKGVQVYMTTDLQSAAKAQLQRGNVPQVAFADEKHAQRICRRCEPIAARSVSLPQ